MPRIKWACMLTFALGPNSFLAIEGKLAYVVVITGLGTICFKQKSPYNINYRLVPATS